MRRRGFLALLGLAGIGAAAWRYWPEQGWWNPCPAPALPDALARHPLLQRNWAGIDPARVWDSHVHLAGVGDSGSGMRIDPAMRSPLHPLAHLQYRFYMNAACVDAGSGAIDDAYLQRLLQLHQGFAPRGRLMLLAFDQRHDAAGRALPQQSSLHVPDGHVAALAQRHSGVFEWIASIHPYRDDCVEALEQAVGQGARAVKWLPSVMGIDPASRRCDAFYDALVKHDMPLLSHAGSEYALELFGDQRLNHPLRLRYPLERGVRVIVAHCASLGHAPDMDPGARGREHRNIDYFARLMADPGYQGRLFGDLAAITAVNRPLAVIETVFRQEAWHERLINGSDYPVPGVMPVYSLRRFVEAGALEEQDAALLTRIRPHNPLLFDFMLKRCLSFGGARLAARVFESARLFGG